MRHRWPVAAAVAAVLLLSVEASVPSDTDAWRPAALDGAVVYDLAPLDDGLLVAAHDGAFAFTRDGAADALDLAGPVRAAVTVPGAAYLGTDDGVVRLVRGRTAADGLPGIGVDDLAASGERVYAAAGDGVHVRTGGAWRRVWAPDERARVRAVAAAGNRVVVAAGDRLHLVDPGSGASDAVWTGNPVEVLTAAGGALWAGVRGEPHLLRSGDGGSTWQPSGEGLIHEGIHALAADPADDRRLYAGGSGLADGEGSAGVWASLDGGATWEGEQDLLSNTHVYGLAAVREPARVGMRLRFTDAETALPLPWSQTRVYAATNGAGVASHRVGAGFLAAAPDPAGAHRVLEPLLAGVLLLAGARVALRVARTRGSPPARRRAREKPVAQRQPTDAWKGKVHT